MATNRNSGGFFNETQGTGGSSTSTFFAQTTDDAHIAILNMGGTPTLQNGITALELRDLIQAGTITAVDNGDNTYTFTNEVDNTTFTIDLRALSANDPRLFTQATQPPIAGAGDPPNGSIWVRTTDYTVHIQEGGIWQEFESAGATNLAVINRTTTSLDIESSTGTDARVPAASGTLAGLLIAEDYNKLIRASFRGDWVSTLAANETPYLMGDIVFDTDTDQFYRLDAEVPFDLMNVRPSIARQDDEGSPIWVLISSSYGGPFQTGSNYEEGSFVTDGDDLYYKLTPRSNDVGQPQLTDRTAWFRIQGPAQPHPFPENVSVTSDPTHIVQGSGQTTVDFTFRETGTNWVITDIDLAVVTVEGVNFLITSTLNDPTVTARAVIPAAAFVDTGTISFSFRVSGLSTDGESYTDHILHHNVIVDANWFAGVRTSAEGVPGANSDLMAEGAFQRGDSVELTGVATGTIYISVPTTSASSVTFTTANPNIFYEATNAGTIGSDHTLFNLGSAVAGTYTVRIGGT